ncbi:MAG: response regulator [Planctomycetota bacterium]
MDAMHTVLVVDDSPTARRSTEQMLADAGYEVVTAADGDDALEIYKRLQPDLVVLDVILPKKNGYQVCRRLKSDSPEHAKILMISSKSLDSDQAWGRQQGADEYLTKPFEADQLLDSVDRLLAKGTA